MRNAISVRVELGRVNDPSVRCNVAQGDFGPREISATLSALVHDLYAEQRHGFAQNPLRSCG